MLDEYETLITINAAARAENKILPFEQLKACVIILWFYPGILWASRKQEVFLVSKNKEPFIIK